MRKTLLAFAVTLLAGCYGFNGGGLPREVKTVAILPFDNETLSPDLPRELTDALREGLEKRLGLKSATEANATAILRGKITRYDLDIAVAVSGGAGQATSARRRMTIGLDVELVQQPSGKVIWQKSGMTADAEYAERGEANGRKQAIERIVADVIEGAQSQW